MALQLCSAEPGTLSGLRAALGDPDILDGVHLRVTVHSHNPTRHRRCRIDTIPVATHPNGIVEIIAVSGHYRFLFVGKGRARLTVRATVTYVDVKGDVDLAVVMESGHIAGRAHNGTVAVNRPSRPATSAAVSGLIRFRDSATVTSSVPTVKVVYEQQEIRVGAAVYQLDDALQHSFIAGRLALNRKWGWIVG